MAGEDTNRKAFAIQQAFCAKMDAAPITGAVAAAVAAALDRGTAIGRRILDWPGEPTADALPLRIVGGLHALAQAGEPALARLFAGGVAAADAAAIVRAAFAAHDAALQPWLDGPPQTNEPGRSGALMTGLLAVAAACGPRLELLEIGSSAGLNLLIGRYRIELGGVRVGPVDAPVRLVPEWRGAPPPDVPVEIGSARGVDITPVDLGDPAAVARLRGYVWADAPERLDRLTRAIAMGPPRPDHGDAADWVEARLAAPQPAGVTRVLMHSVVWQYLPAATAARIEAAMARAGAAATPERPLGWAMMEPRRDLARHEVRVRTWPGGGGERVVAHAHPHGAWIEGV